jgi:hypothetical protein
MTTHEMIYGGMRGYIETRKQLSNVFSGSYNDVLSTGRRLAKHAAQLRARAEKTGSRADWAAANREQQIANMAMGRARSARVTKAQLRRYGVAGTVAKTLGNTLSRAQIRSLRKIGGSPEEVIRSLASTGMLEGLSDDDKKKIEESIKTLANKGANDTQKDLAKQQIAAFREKVVQKKQEERAKTTDPSYRKLDSIDGHLNTIKSTVSAIMNKMPAEGGEATANANGS